MSVLDVHCYVTNHPKTSHLRRAINTTSHVVSDVRNLGVIWDYVVVVSEGLTGAGGSSSKVFHSRGWHIGAGYWQEALFLALRTSLHTTAEYPFDMMPGFLQTN